MWHFVALNGTPHMPERVLLIIPTTTEAVISLIESFGLSFTFDRLV
jgi:hypothetical protein